MLAYRLPRVDIEAELHNDIVLVFELGNIYRHIYEHNSRVISIEDRLS